MQYNLFLPSCQIYEGEIDKFTQSNEHGKAFVIVALRY